MDTQNTSDSNRTEEGSGDDHDNEKTSNDKRGTPIGSTFPTTSRIFQYCARLHSGMETTNPDKIVKEFVEASPVLDAVVRYINDDENGDDGDSATYTIIDIASGKGFLSMILSEILPPSKINQGLAHEESTTAIPSHQLGTHVWTRRNFRKRNFDTILSGDFIIDQ